MLFLFEYRAATLLIQTQFPGPTAAAITKFEIDDDIISLDGRNPLCTESETDQNGRIRVRIRRSTSSVPGSSALSSSMGLTPRPSNLSNAEIFSINTPHHHANLEFTLGSGDVAFGYRSTSPQLSAGYASSDAYSLQPTPRASTFNEIDTTTFSTTANTPVWARSPATGRFSQQPSPTFNGVKMVWESPAKCQGGDQRQGYFKEVGGTYAYRPIYLLLLFRVSGLKGTGRCRIVGEEHQRDMQLFQGGCTL